MKKVYVFLIIVGMLLAVLTMVGVVASRIELNTYVATMDIEGVNSYPPRLTKITDRGVEVETVLVSIMPQLSIPRLSITPAKTTFSGTITLICGAGYSEIQDWEFESSVYGEGMEQRIIFKKLPGGSDCIAYVITTECETDQAKCEKSSLYHRFQTP